MTWTDSEIDMLTRMWADGASSSKIADAINRVFGAGYTRNAIIGKRLRLGLPTRSKSALPTSGRKPSRPAKRRRASNGMTIRIPDIPKDPPPIDADAIAFDDSRTAAGLKSLVDIDDHECRWPIGDPQRDDFGFCGVNAVPGQPYCRHHTSRAFRHGRVIPRSSAPEPTRAYQPTKSKEFA